MRPKGVYYGWFVLAALCITETVTWGIIYYCAAGTEVSRESTTPAAATDRSA